MLLHALCCWAVALPTLFLVTAWVVERCCPRLRQMSGSEGTKASLLFAYSATCVVSNAYLAIAGLLAWLPCSPMVEITAAAAVDRLYADVPYVGLHILSPMLAHCGWDLVLYLTLAELREPSLMAHHAMTGLLGLLALWPTSFGHYFDIYFAGVAELSNLPLAIMEVFKLIPELRPQYPQLHRTSRCAFNIFFAVLRLGCWPALSYQFWKDVIGAIASRRIHSLSVAYVYLACNAVLTLMQLFWGSKLFGSWLRRIPFRRAKGIKET